MYVSNYSLMLPLCPKFSVMPVDFPFSFKNKKYNNLWVCALMKQNAFTGHSTLNVPC